MYMSSAKQSEITIGLCVHNGQAHLAEAIESLLTQGFSDFQLLIFDNASDDDTPKIARRYAARDSRVRLIRHSRNLGPVRNFAAALEYARSPLFCWASCDDLREPSFLQQLRDLLMQHPEADLACCAVRDLDWHGNPHRLHHDTDVMADMNHPAPVERFKLYLQHSPCTPIYGLFRREAAQSLLGLLDKFDRKDQRGTFRSDALFLAGIVSRFRAVYTSQPLFFFRCGGSGQRLDNHRGLLDLMRDYLRFSRILFKIATDIPAPPHTHTTPSPNRAKLILFTLSYLCRYFLQQPTRRILCHHITTRFRCLKHWRAVYDVSKLPAFNRLKQHARQETKNHRVALFGAGKHTQRHYHTIIRALGKHHQVVGIIDDHPEGHPAIHGLPILHTDQLTNLNPSVILVSSDTYEQLLLKRARQIAPPDVKVWSIYTPLVDNSYLTPDALVIPAKAGIQ